MILNAFSQSFHQDGSKGKTGSSCTSPRQAKVKALKDKRRRCQKLSTASKEDSHFTHLREANAQIPLEEHACKKQAWPLRHHQIVPYYWVKHREGKRQQHTCSLCKSRLTGHTGCEEILWHWWGQSQYPDTTAWWSDGLCSAESWLWCSGCWQQNWDHLNWVQLASSKYTFPPPATIKRGG